MTVKFGMLTNPTQDIMKEIKKAQKMGFDVVEIGIEPPMGDPDILIAKKKVILEELKKRKLLTIGHTFWICDLGSVIEELRRVWIEEGKKYIETAYALDIKLLNFHAHTGGMLLEVDKFKKQVLDNFVDSLEELMAYAKPFGIKLMIENMPSKSMKLKDFKYVMNRLPGLGMHLDVAHAFVTGGMKTVLDFINTFKNRLLHIHVSDNHGEEDEHIAIGKGDIDYERVVAELKKIGYDRAITFEIFFGGRKALANSKKRIEKMWKTIS